MMDVFAAQCCALVQDEKIKFEALAQNDQCHKFRYDLKIMESLQYITQAYPGVLDEIAFNAAASIINNKTTGLKKTFWALDRELESVFKNSLLGVSLSTSEKVENFVEREYSGRPGNSLVFTEASEMICMHCCLYDLKLFLENG